MTRRPLIAARCPTCGCRRQAETPRDAEGPWDRRCSGCGEQWDPLSPEAAEALKRGMEDVRAGRVRVAGPRSDRREEGWWTNPPSTRAALPPQSAPWGTSASPSPNVSRAALEAAEQAPSLLDAAWRDMAERASVDMLERLERNLAAMAPFPLRRVEVPANFWTGSPIVKPAPVCLLTFVPEEE